MKRFPCVLISIFAFFFLILPVNADTINITLPEGWLDLVENGLPSMQSQVNSYNSSWPNLVSTDYYIYCNYNFSTCYSRHIRTSYANNYSSINYTGSIVDNNYLITLNTSRTYVISNYLLSNDNYSTLYSCNSNDCPNTISFIYYWPGYNNSVFFPLYSTINIGASSINSHTYIFSYGSWTYTLESGFTSFPTLYDLYQDYNSTPPPPSDDFPLLTSFYTTCLNSFSIVVEEFTTNYIYLAIITIFLLITMIYLLKRRFS